MPPPDFNPPIRFSRLVFTAFLWMIPVFFLYLALLRPVLLPGLTAINHRLLQAAFSSADPSLVLTDQHEWHIHTKVLMPDQVPGKILVLSMKIGKPGSELIGLPLLWILLLAIPQRRVKNLLWGSLLIFGALSLYDGLWVAGMISHALSERETYTVFVPGQGIVPLAPYPTWLPTVLTELKRLLGNLLVLAGPVGLAYGLNRKWWQRAGPPQDSGISQTRDIKAGTIRPSRPAAPAD